MNNRRPTSGWELKLGLPHVVVLVGLITGSMVLAFYLGLNSGQRLGFELAQERSATSLPRLPVPGAAPEGSLANDDGAFDVYAKLNDTLPGEKGETDPIKVAPIPEAESPLDRSALFPSESPAGGKSTGMPELGSIKSVESAPLINPEAEAALTARLEAEVAPAGAEPKLGDVAKEALKADLKVEEPTTVAIAPPAVAAPEELPTKVVERTEPSESVEKKTIVKDTAKIASPERRSPFLKDKIPSGWFAQVVALQSLDEADALAAKLKGSGFPVMIEAARVRGQDYFRILVGPERSRQHGDILISQIRRERYISGTPFLRFVK